MYLVEIHIFTASNTVYWIIWLVCVRLCAKCFFLVKHFSAHFSFFLRFFPLSHTFSLTHSSVFLSIFGSFYSFTCFFIKPLWRQSPHYTRMWIYGIYKQSFYFCFHYLIIIYYRCHWRSVSARLLLYVCMRIFFFIRIILRACVNFKWASVHMYVSVSMFVCMFVNEKNKEYAERFRWKHCRY